MPRQLPCDVKAIGRKKFGRRRRRREEKANNKPFQGCSIHAGKQRVLLHSMGSLVEEVAKFDFPPKRKYMDGSSQSILCMLQLLFAKMPAKIEGQFVLHTLAFRGVSMDDLLAHYDIDGAVGLAGVVAGVGDSIG